MFDPNVNFSSLVDSNSNTYTLVGSEQLIGSAPVNGKSRLYRCENGTGSGSHTSTLTLSASAFKTVLFIELLHGLSSGAFDKVAQGSDTTTPYASPATTTTAQANEMVVGALHGYSGDTTATHSLSGATPSTGWTIPSAAEEVNGATYWEGCMAYVRVTSTGTYQASFTDTTATSSARGIFTATFNEEAGAAAASLLPKRRFNNALLLR
jgi:hypothetical protein